jgi:RHS repeat-associated protein
MEMSQLNVSQGPNRYQYNGKEIQDDFGLYWYDYGARFYDPMVGRWHSVDPMAHLREWVSPYNFVQNNPINRVDPTGALDTEFKDQDGKTIKKVDDGSNAVFQLTGNRWSDQYFKFTGYDESQGGKNEVNIQTVIDFTQDYTRENYKSVHRGYKKDDAGNFALDEKGNKIDLGWQTYCNFGTRCIGTSVASGLEAMGLKMDISVLQGSAKNIYDALCSNYISLTLEEAQKAAKEGGFVVGGWSSHAFTLNKQGIINNVGAPRANNNLWDPQYNLPKTTKFYQLYKPVITNPQVK